MSDQSLVAAFVRWTWMRAFLHHGWWLVTSVYLVVDAGLSPSQLVFIGTAQGVIALSCEVPAGVLADTVSRRWSLVISQVLMGTAMLITGTVTAFPALVATQMLWGLSWTFASGTDVAWITDELERPHGVSAVLARAGRAQLTGSATGMVGFGLLAWATQRGTAMVLAGAAMLLLGLYVVVRFREDRFVPARTRRWSASVEVFRRGLSLVRRSRELLVIFAATFLVNGAHVSGRLYPKHLLDLGFPTAPDPMVWFTALGVGAMLIGAAALRLVERRLDGRGAARRGYALAAVAGTGGLVVLALAPDAASGCAAVLLVRGIAIPLTRVIGTIWANSLITGDVRATVHSFLAQAEYVGAIACGAAFTLLAQATTLSVTLLACAACFALAVALVIRAPCDPREPASADG